MVESKIVYENLVTYSNNMENIINESKKRYPYLETDNANVLKKKASKRRRFIEGATFALELIKTK